jgi:DNA polymerase-3 subunit delta
MSVHVLKGDDPILRADALEALVTDLLAGDDRSLALEEFTVPGRAREGEVGGEEERRSAVAGAVNAASSPPFMTEGRVVVLRDVGHLLKDEAAPIVSYLEDPMPTTHLVVVAGGGRTPDALAKACKAAGATDHGPANTSTPDVLDAALSAAGLALRPRARSVLLDRVGADAGRIPAMVEVLAAAFGPGSTLGPDDVAPYLGDAGSVPPYELTNAIESGDVAGALELCSRLLNATGPQQPKPMHPLQVLAMLHNRYRRIARLDDPGIRTEADAVAALGGNVKAFTAKKTLDQTRRLGTEGIRDAYALLAQADLDLKGARAIPEDAVIEVLVARLAAQTARVGARSGRRR